MAIRAILHVDMDAFYASVEQRDHPSYRHKPVIVGADPKGGRGRGVVAACSYEARHYGVHSAMPIRMAYQACPNGIFLRPDFPRYTKVSHDLRKIFCSITDQIEPLSIDEAFLDVSQRVRQGASAVDLARYLKQLVQEGQSLTASIGVAPNKFLAKIASDLQKPNGLVVVPEKHVLRFLDPLSIGRIWGVGPKTEARLKLFGIETIRDLRQVKPDQLKRSFGKMGEHLWTLSRGVDPRPVVTSRKPKSLSQEHTFAKDILAQEVLERMLARLTEEVYRRLVARDLLARTVTLKLRYSDFTTITRQRTLPHPLEKESEILEAMFSLLRQFRDLNRRVRLIGVLVSSLGCSTRIGIRQLLLFPHSGQNSERMQLPG